MVAAPTLLPGDGRVQRARRAFRHPPGGRPERDRGGGKSDRGDAARAPRRGDDRQRWQDRRRDARPTSSPARCQVKAEVRSLDEDKATAKTRRDGRCAHLGCKQHRDRRGHARSRSSSTHTGSPSPNRCVVAAAMRSGTVVSSRDMSPAAGEVTRTRLRRRGLRCLNIANGTEANHTPEESVSEQALEKMLEVTVPTAAASRGGVAAMLELRRGRVVTVTPASG